MKVKQGAFRLWVVVTVLWVGLICWSWQEQFVWSLKNKCWASTYSWTTARPSLDHLSNDWDGPKPNDNECDVMEEYPIDFLPKAIAYAASLPGGLLAVWIIGAWVLGGFRGGPKEPGSGSSGSI